MRHKKQQQQQFATLPGLQQGLQQTLPLNIQPNLQHYHNNLHGSHPQHPPHGYKKYPKYYPYSQPTAPGGSTSLLNTTLGNQVSQAPLSAPLSSSLTAPLSAPLGTQYSSFYAPRPVNPQDPFSRLYRDVRSASSDGFQNGFSLRSDVTFSGLPKQLFDENPAAVGGSLLTSSTPGPAPFESELSIWGSSSQSSQSSGKRFGEKFGTDLSALSYF